jgi:hypothetical protein
MEALTPASPDSLPSIGDLIADEPFWRYPLGAVARQGVAHLRMWLTAGPEPGHLAVVTQTGSALGPPRAELLRPGRHRYNPPPGPRRDPHRPRFSRDATIPQVRWLTSCLTVR